MEFLASLAYELPFLFHLKIYFYPYVISFLDSLHIQGESGGNFEYRSYMREKIWNICLYELGFGFLNEFQFHPFLEDIKIS